MAFELTVLGCSSATPIFNRHPSAQVLKVNEQFFLIDCGEATQMQLRKFNIPFNKINNIFITHLHGDHFLGLIGLISSMHLFGRNKDLNIYANKELKKIINLCLDLSNTKLSYNLIYHDLQFDLPRVIYNDDNIFIETIILKHKIDCCGFLFKEKNKLRKINKEIVQKLNIPIDEMNNLKSGKDLILNSDTTLKNSDLTLDPLPPCSFAYCSDTIYSESIIEQISNIDLLYHEATFMADMQNVAIEKFHSTTSDAAKIALKANVKTLLIGHFSARYKDLNPLLFEAKQSFKNTILAEEGLTLKI